MKKPNSLFGQPKIVQALSLIALLSSVLLLSFLLISNGDENSLTTNTSVEIHDIHGLQVDIENSNRVYLSSHTGLYVRDDNAMISKIGEFTGDLMGFTISPINTNTFYASGHPSLQDGGGSFGLIGSKDGGVTWKQISSGLNGPADYHALALDPKNENIIYGYYDGKIQKTSDGGKTWEYLEASPKNIIQLQPGKKANQLYAATTNGLHVSNNGGQNWTLVSFSNQTVIACKVDPVSGKIIAFTSELGLVYSEKDNDWQQVNFGDNESEIVLHIAFSATDPKKVYLITQSLKLFHSTDGGLTWKLLHIL